MVCIASWLARKDCLQYFPIEICNLMYSDQLAGCDHFYWGRLPKLEAGV